MYLDSVFKRTLEKIKQLFRLHKKQETILFLLFLALEFLSYESQSHKSIFTMFCSHLKGWHRAWNVKVALKNKIAVV